MLLSLLNMRNIYIFSWSNESMYEWKLMMTIFQQITTFYCNIQPSSLQSLFFFPMRCLQAHWNSITWITLGKQTIIYMHPWLLELWRQVPNHTWYTRQEIKDRTLKDRSPRDIKRIICSVTSQEAHKSYARPFYDGLASQKFSIIDQWALTTVSNTLDIKS